MGSARRTYARDIIYPALALKKLAEPRVQVTEEDIKDAFETNYGPQLRCRVIMTQDIHKANGDLERASQEPRFVREARQGAFNGQCHPSLWRHASRPDRPARLPPDGLEGRIPPSLSTATPKDKQPRPQAQGRRHHRTDPGRTSRTPGSS